MPKPATPSLLASLPRKLLWRLGYQLSRRPPAGVASPGGPQRPVGVMTLFLEDLAARGLRPASILDVGAHRADWSRWARRAFPDARFTLVEPREEMREAMERFCREAPGSRYVVAGAGPRAEERPLAVFPDADGSSILLTPREAEERGLERRPVRLLTLDSLFADDTVPLPELVKLDVQGFELEALRGAPRILAAAEVVVLEVSFFPFMENWPTVSEVVAFMTDQGYEPYDVCGALRRTYDGALGQADLAFARREGRLRAYRLFGHSMTRGPLLRASYAQSDWRCPKSSSLSRYSGRGQG
jgi:FkbM family methyltransferase